MLKHLANKMSSFITMKFQRNSPGRDILFRKDFSPRSCSSVHISSATQSCLTICYPMDCSTPGFPVHHESPSLPKLMSIESVMPSNHLILVISFSSCLQSVPASGSFPISQFFTSGSQSIGVSASACLSNEYSGLISFRMDWLDLLAVQGTLKSLLQYHSSKASIFWHSAFFLVQLSHPCMTTRKTIALTRWTFVGKVMFLLFNMLSRSVIIFLPRASIFLISWLQSPSTMILEPPQNKICHCFHCFSFYLP